MMSMSDLSQTSEATDQAPDTEVGVEDVPEPEAQPETATAIEPEVGITPEEDLAPIRSSSITPR